MKRTIKSNHLILGTLAALLLAVAIPSAALAQGNSQGHGRGHNRDWSSRNDRHVSKNWDKHNRKCAKFVNCHDARAGRVDGRGPRGTLVGNNVWRNRLRNRRTINNLGTYRNQRRYRRVTLNR